MSKFEHDLFDNKHFMSQFKSIFRIISLFILGLLGVVLLGSGLWFAFQGGPIAGVLMVVSAGGMLAGWSLGWRDAGKQRGRPEKRRAV